MQLLCVLFLLSVDPILSSLLYCKLFEVRGSFTYNWLAINAYLMKLPATL